MQVLLILAGSIAFLGLGGFFYSRFLGKSWGEDPSRTTPAVRQNDGRDFVPTPTAVVFAHHFASIAGAGPIIGPVIAMCYGWLPGLLWVLAGGLFIGGVHDYLAAFMAVRFGGRSMATVVRMILGTGPFLALMLFLILSLALVCATFLNLSATALTSMVPHARLGMSASQTIFRVVGEGDSAQVVIGGIASTSVIVITAFAPLLGWLYLRKGVAVWKCSLLALAICAVSVVAGIIRPVALHPDVWKKLLAVYVLVAAGVPVWIFLQSRDFINVHILYAGLALLLITLAVAGWRMGSASAGETLPAMAIAQGEKANGFLWPALFVTIACGAVSGFHSLCAGGTTCKQLRTEPAARHVGYWAMLLESLLSVSVIAVMVAGSKWSAYLGDVHPALVGSQAKANPILGFAMAVGRAGNIAWHAPIAAGALAGMILLEGFLVTTLDTAVRLMRYLLEETWRCLFGMTPIEASSGSETASGSCGIPSSLADGSRPACPEGAKTTATPSGIGAGILSHFWVNSGIAVALTLWFAMSSTIMQLWSLFATANQLLAGFVLGLGALWLLRQRRRVWYVVLPALFMLATTTASLCLLFRKFMPGREGNSGNPVLFAADIVLFALTAYLVAAGIRLAFLTISGKQPAVDGPAA